MSALNAWLKKYGGATTQPAQTDQDDQKNALSAWLEKYNNFTPSGADTVQPPAEPQPNGYKSQNAAHLSSGLSRDDFDSSVRNRNQLRALEAQQKNINPPENSPAKPATLLESVRPTQTTPTTPYFSYGTNKPSSLAEAEKYIQDTSKTMEVLSSEIEFGNSTLGARENKINDYISRLENLAQEMQNNPTAQKYSAYNTLYDEYQKYYAEYESFLSEHNAKIGLYNDYAKRYETAGNIYNTENQQYYDQWKSSVRSTDRAGTEEIDREISETEKKFLAAMSPAEKSKYGEKLQRLTEEKYYSDYLYYQGNMRSTSEILSDIAEAQKGPLGPNEKKIKALEKELSFTYDLIPTLEGFRDNGAGAPGFTFYMPPYVEGDADVPASYYNTFDPESKDAYRQMTTAEERGIFQYLLNTEGEEAAEAYMERMKGTLKNRLAGEVTEPYREYANNHPILSSIESVIIAPAKAFSYAGQLKDFILDGEIDETAAYNSPSMAQTSIRNEVSKDMNAAESFFYQTGMSVGDFLFTTAASGGFSGGGAVSEGVSLILMGGGAAADTVIAAKNNGRSDKEAILLGTAAGVIETVTEKIGYDALFDSALRGESVVRYLLKNSLSESAEEGTSKLLNTFADFLISGVMGTETDIQRRIKELVSNGYTYSEATGIVYADWVSELGTDMLGGFLSGFAMSGGSVAIDKTSNALGQKMDVQAQIREQEQAIKNADAVIGAYAEAVQKYGENSPQAMELKSKAERAYIEKVRANLRLGMLNGKSTTVTTQERSEEEITRLVTQAQATGDATAETGYYAGASDQLIKFAQQEKAILKQLTGRDVDIRFYQADVGENGHYDPGTGTIYVNVNSAQPFSYIEGHEFTHELENSAGYAEYAEWVKTEGLGAMYNTYKENIKRRYESRGINLTELDLEQEVVATWTGENLFTDDTTMKKLIKKLSDGKPTLARKIFGGIRRFVSRPRSGITRNHYERALYLYQQMAQGKASAVSSAQTVNENAPTSFPAETTKASQKQKNTAEAVNTAENDIMISNDEAVAQDNGKFANDSEFTPAVRELVDRIADTARQIEASDQKGADYRRLKKEQKANLRALEQLRREGKIDSVEYNRAIETLRDTTEGPEYSGIEESKANLQAQFEAGEIALEDYESAMAELEEVGAEESSPGKIKYSLSETIAPTRKELESKNPIKVVNVKVGLESESYADMKVAAKNKATNEGWFDIPHHNVDTDSFIFLTEKSFTHAFSNLRSDFGEDTIRCMAHIPEIIQEAVLVSVDNPKDNRKAETKVYTFLGAIDGINGVEPVKLTVKEFDFRSLDAVPKNIRNYFEKNGISEKYNSLYDTHALEVIGIEGIQKESDASGRVGEQSSRAQATSDSIISIADLLNLVKGEAEKYIPKYSFEDLDNEYLGAVNSGDMETARRLVEEAARISGYTDKVYHGTQQFGFTVFDPKYSDDGISLFAAGSPDLAQTYSGIPKVREVSDKSYDSESTNGNYALYAKPGNQLVIDGNGRHWSDIRYWSRAFEKTKDSTYVQKSDGYYVLIDRNTGEEISDGEIAINAYTERLGLSQLHAVMLDKVNEMFRIRTENLNTTRDVVRYAKKLGYDSVKFENIQDDGGRGVSVQEPQDVYAYFNPNDLKSADTVTYDENGNIIPLSERFNSEKTDIRFSLEDPTREDVISELRQYMNGARSKDQIRDVIARVKKNPQSEIYGGPARRPQYSEGVQRILADAEREGMSVRDYISQNIDEFEVRGKLTEDARKALEISGDYRKFSVEDVRANRPPRSIEELDRILAEAEPLDSNEFRKTDFDRWYERREKEDQLREKMAEHVTKSPDENEINTTLEELASDLENGYITPAAALEVVEGLRETLGTVLSDNIITKLSDILRRATTPYSAEEIKSILRDGKNQIAASYNDVLAFISNAKQNGAFGRLFIGKLNQSTVQKIKSMTQVAADNKSVVLTSDELKHIFRQHGNEKTEELRGQEAITPRNFHYVLDAIFSPDNVELLTDDSGVSSLIFRKNSKNKVTAVTVVSEKKKALTLKSAWITKKGQHISPPSDVQAPNQTSKNELSMNAIPTDSVTDSSSFVKTKEQFSVEDIEIQPIEESSDGPAMQNYNRLYEGDEFEDDKTAKSYQRLFPAEAVEYLRGKYRITNEQEAAEAYQSSIRLKDQVRRTELRLKISEQDKALALEILCGDKNISDIQNASDKEGLLEYIAVLGEAEVMAEAWKNWKTEKRTNWQKEADEMFKTFDSSVKGGFKYDKKDNIKTDKRGNPKFQEEATNKAGYKYVRETQTRITYDIFADDKFAEAKAFNDWLFEPERASEAQSNRYKNKMRDQVRELKLGTKIQKGNAVSESAAVQILGELQDIIRRTTRQADMGNADTYRVNGLTYNEAVWSLAELKKQNPNMDFSENGKIQKAVEKFGQLYAEMLSDMNQTLVRNGYPPVPARSGYFPHFADEGDTLIRRIGRALGIDTDVSVLPTGINGLTHTFKPGKTWFANALERKGHKTAYDAVLGFDKYIEGAANVIFHTDNIQRQRYFARAIRYNASDEAIKAKIDEITANDTLNEDEKDLQIQYVTSRTKFRHSTYVVQLEDHTNSLAGKKTFSDRDMERLMGRKAYTWMKNIEGRVAANMIAGNMSSALSNFIPLQYCEAEIGLGYTLQAMGQTIKSFFGDDGFKDRSDFLTNRYGSEFLVKSGMDKISERLSVPMEAIDHFTAQVLVRAAYNKYSKKGASPELAMERANSFAAGVMADRSRGALPEIFNNKNPLYKSFTMFQVEVNNNLSHIFKDIPRENRDKWWGAVLGILAKLFFGIWIFNETSEKLTGRRMAGTDVIDAGNEFVGNLAGYRPLNIFDMIEAKIDGKSIRDMAKADKVGAGQAILNLGGTAAEDLPFVSSFLGGGDLPVGSAMPDLSKLLPLLDSDKDTENVKQTVYEELLKPVSYAVLPFGANQLSKIAKGHQAFRKGGSYKTNSKGEDILQYPIYAENKGEAIWNFIKATVFGKSSFPGAREWVENDFKSLSARGTAAYKGMIAAGVPEKDAYDLVIDIASVSPSDQEIMEQVISMGGVDRVFSETVSNGPTSAELKCEIIRNADISDEGKAILYFAMIANESECNFMSSMQEAGADMGAVVAELIDTSTKSSDRKYAAIMSSGLPEAEQLWQIYLLDTSAEKSTHKRYYVASDTFGISPNEYRVAKDFVTEHLNGASLSNMRVEEAIREYAKTVPLTKIEKAALWQIILGRDSAKNNPFDVSTGEKVVRAMANYDEEERAFYEKYGPKPTN